MVTLLWSVKGGSGTTVVSSLIALDPSRPSLLIDLDGEVPAVLGLPEPDRPGVVDWLVADGQPSQLIDLVVDANDDTAVLPCRRTGTTWDDGAGRVDSDRYRLLVGWAREWERRHDGVVVIDAGTGDVDPTLAAAVDVRLLVTRACYLGLRRAAAAPVRPTGVVLVMEAGRSLRRKDVQRSLAAPIVASIDADPAIARCVDSGLLVSRAPRSVRRELARVLEASSDLRPSEVQPSDMRVMA